MSTTTSHLHDTVAFAPPSDDEIERGDEPRPQLQIIQRVQAAIRLGEYAPKALLPMRDDFMREFSVSRVTVQRAFNRLIADGFVTTRGSQGTYVAPRPPNVFRIGLVFDESKADALRDKYRMSVLSAAAHWDESAAFTIAPYYGMAEYRAGGDKDRLLQDLRHDRLAGVIAVTGDHAWPAAIRRLAAKAPSVHWGTPAPLAYAATIRNPGLVECAIAEVKRMGGRRVAALTLAQAWEVHAAPLQRQAADAGLTMPAPWVMGFQRDYPQWTRPALALLFGLPEGGRPDSLIVMDDHLAEQAAIGLVEAGVSGTVKTVMHANFPTPAALSVPAVRVGVDSEEIIADSTGLIAGMLEADRAGTPRPMPCRDVPHRPEHALRRVRVGGPTYG